MRSVDDRFWGKVNKTDDCWVWTASTDSKGYGRFTVAHDVKVAAHRWAYESLVGPIGDGLELDHLCRNRACVNPFHLDPVPHLENVRRGDAWTVSGLKTHCPSGHEYTGGNLYVRPSDGARVCRACTRDHQRRRRASRAHVSIGG